MIIKKTIKIPFYYINLKIIFVKNLKLIEKKYNFSDLSKYSAITFSNCTDNKNECIVAFSEYDLSVIAHEVVHIKNYVFKESGVKLDVNNDEAEAYLVGFLFKAIQQFLSKKKLLFK